MEKTESNNSVLVLNAGSSSIKFAVFTADLIETLSGITANMGGASFLTIAGKTVTSPFIDHKSALRAAITALKSHGCYIKLLKAAVHRVVHSSRKLTAPIRITPEVRSEIYNCTTLAPLHNPHNLAAIDAIQNITPRLPQFASFDTSFQATNPDVATRYATPRMMETKGIRRYEFHSLFYASLVTYLPSISSEKLHTRRLAFHLGNGASLCAIQNEQSVAKTIGYSPLDRLTMATRSGGIDVSAFMLLVEDNVLERTKAILNQESELLDLSGGKLDMRDLMLDPSKESAFAVEHFCYWSMRHDGSLVAAMEGVDALTFTGGIEGNAPGVRALISRGPAWAGVRMNPDANYRNDVRLHAESSKVKAWVIPAKEEQMIAADALTLMAAT